MDSLDWSFRSRFGGLLRTAALCSSCVLCGTAVAQDATTRVNDLYSDISRGANGVDPGQRSDLVLLPLVVQMDPIPATDLLLDQDAQSLRLLDAEHPRWAELVSWAESSPQRAVLEALDTVTEEEDPVLSMAFGLPYGQEAAIDFFDLGLRDEVIDKLIDPLEGVLTNVDSLESPLLGIIDLGGLLERGIKPIVILGHVEAVRLAEQGDVVEAMDVLADVAFFGRQLIDRELSVEQVVGYSILMVTCERMRDLAYVDSERPSPSLARNGVALKSVLDRLARLKPGRVVGYLEMRRTNLPQGDRLAAEELVRYTMPSAFADSDRFSAVMSFAAGDPLNRDLDPIRLLGEMAYWEEQASGQAGRDDTLAAISRSWGDMDTRWERDAFFDESLRGVPEIQRLDDAQYQIVRSSLARIYGLIYLRQAARTELGGTRVALNVLMRKYSAGAYGTDVTAGATDWLNGIVDKDPYHPDFEIRDWNSSATNYGYKRVLGSVQVALDTESGNFSRTFNRDEDVFLLYSMGPDHADNAGRRVKNTAVATPGSEFDYMIWPPLSTLERRYLRGE